VVIGESDTTWVCPSLVRERPDPQHVRLEMTGEASQRRQRREYFRSPIHMSVLIDRTGRAYPGTLDLDKPFLPAELATGLFLLSVRDLSGGGCLCLDPERALQHSKIYGAWIYLGDGLPPVPLQVQVVRRAYYRGTPAAGLQFISLKENTASVFSAPSSASTVAARPAKPTRSKPAAPSPPYSRNPSQQDFPNNAGQRPRRRNVPPPSFR